MADGLREALLDLPGDAAPVLEAELQVFGVGAVLPGQAADKGDDVVGDVVLHGRAVADGVDVAERGAVEA